MRLGVLASGSRGNAFAVEHNGLMILIDAGLSGRQHTARLAQSGFSGIEPGALFISHEHSDHVSGAGVLARLWRIPVYGTEGTLNASERRLGKVPETRVFNNGTSIDFGVFSISSFSIAHDAADPSGYVIRWDEGQLGIATDLGHSNPLVRDNLSGCTAIVLEFNHDENMLWEGSYPWVLKQRIASSTGHLSNRAASELLQSVAHDGLELCVMAHLSKENNLPSLAEKALREVTEGSVKILAAQQDLSLPALDLQGGK
jgi:phosphoribosyl 1,2-cyclic phosphodiesterase